MKKRTMAAVLAAGMVMSVSLAGCGSTGTTADVTTDEVQTDAVETAPAEETAPVEETTADAEQTDTAGSGKVTVYMPSPAGFADKLAEGFYASTGIEVEQFQGTP